MDAAVIGFVSGPNVSAELVDDAAKVLKEAKVVPGRHAFVFVLDIRAWPQRRSVRGQ